MPHYLIKVTDNTLHAVIVFSLLALLAALVLRKGDRAPMACGVALGFAIALTYAILKRNTGFAVREFYDLGVITPSLLLQFVMFASLWRLFAEGKKTGMAGRSLITLSLASLTAYALPNIMLYPFEFAVGMESVFNTEFLYRVIGYSLGLLLMFLLGLGIFKISSRLPRRFLQALFFAVLLVFCAKLALEMTQILVARSMVPRGPRLMSLVIFVLTHVNWFAFAIMGLVFFFTASLVARIRFEPLPDGNPAVRRKRKAGNRNLYRHSACVFFCLLVSALTITEIRAYANREVEISPPLEIAAVDGKILLPIETINDGNLHRFQYRNANGAIVRYIVIKKSETAYGVGLDACDICGPSAGYYQRKDKVICKLCDVVMNTSTIGFPGGCNPVPLRFSISQGNMVILAADLDAEQARFR
ncbi:MAG: Fe-S-containing protein [Desulfovibrio sp.]|jgi:uncharacterized membrane protein|nr:Fe-S-containing protein [Desulfovibrio sp.]